MQGRGLGLKGLEAEILRISRAGACECFEVGVTWISVFCLVSGCGRVFKMLNVVLEWIFDELNEVLSVVCKICIENGQFWKVCIIFFLYGDMFQRILY